MKASIIPCTRLINDTGEPERVANMESTFVVQKKNCMCRDTQEQESIGTSNDKVISMSNTFHNRKTSANITTRFTDIMGTQEDLGLVADSIADSTYSSQHNKSITLYRGQVKLKQEHKVSDTQSSSFGQQTKEKTLVTQQIHDGW